MVKKSFLLFVQFAVCCLLTGGSPSLAEPGEEFASFTPDGAWCWFSDPRAIYRDGMIYSGWMTADGSVQVGAMDERTRKVRTTTLAEKFERDDHDTPALLFLPDGRLAVFYSQHAKGDLHLRVTTQPADITHWTPDRLLGFENKGEGSKGVTYANPALLSEENNAIYLFWRGSDFKPNLSTSKDLGKTWSEPQTLIRRSGSGVDNRPYLKMWSDGKCRIDLVFTDGHPRDEPSNSVYFLRYEKGAFYKADGTRVGGMEDLPFEPAQCDRIYDGATAGRAWIWDLCEDARGNPLVAYTRLPAEENHRYCLARWDGQRWQDQELRAAGGWFPKTPPGQKEREPHYSGGMAMDPLNPFSVYLSRPTNAVFEIERLVSLDEGKSWRSDWITFGSELDNVRPFVVRNHPTDKSILMWMSNNEYVHYTDYRSAIKIAELLPPLSAALEPAKVLAAMERVADWQLAHPPSYRKTDWRAAAGWTGMMALADVSSNSKYYDAMLQMGRSLDWKLGPRPYFADDQCIGQTYLELYFRDHDAKIIESLRRRFDDLLAHPKEDDLDFKKKGASDLWSWCDSLFMAPPVWIRLWAATGEQKYLDFMVEHWWKTSDFLYDKDEHLYFRDSTYFERREANGKKVFWSRGNGWVMAGLARVLSYLPPTNPARARFAEQFREMAGKLITLQQADGLWRSSLLDPESYPRKETSGSAFYCHAFAWGINQGLLERAKFEPAVIKAWQALVGCVNPDGMLTHVQPVGADPKSFDENSTDAFGVGAFLLAGSEVYRLGLSLPRAP